MNKADGRKFERAELDLHRASDLIGCGAEDETGEAQQLDCRSVPRAA